MKALVVGAGLSGCVIAERMAAAGHDVLVVEARKHIAGNCYDELDEHGVLVHRYGPHCFHTNSQAVWDYLSRFTQWRPYEHRVLAAVRGMLVPLPINLRTLRMLGMELKPEPQREIHNSEDVVLSTVGRELYEDFYRGYTCKQWGREPSELAASVCARIPVRVDEDDRYFADKWQAVPAEGYTMMCAAMLRHPCIEVQTQTAYWAGHPMHHWDRLVWTGTLDSYFGYRLGRLPYRSLRFETEHYARPWYQQTGTVNFPSMEVPYTRVVEWKHLTGQQHRGTTITREYPSATGEPYYPVPAPESAALAAKYAELAKQERNVYFVGRLAQYRYLNMDQAVAAALRLAKELM